MTPEILLGTRLAIHVATVALLASYFNPDARFKLGPSVIAGMLLASSGSMAVQIVTEWSKLVAADPQPQLVIFVFTVFIPIAWCRGNIARLYQAMSQVKAAHWWPWR